MDSYHIPTKPNQHNPGQEKDDTEEGFGGLLPTSTRPGATVEKLDADQASDKAWNKVFGAKQKVSA